MRKLLSLALSLATLVVVVACTDSGVRSNTQLDNPSQGGNGTSSEFNGGNSSNSNNDASSNSNDGTSSNSNTNGTMGCYVDFGDGYALCGTGAITESNCENPTESDGSMAGTWQPCPSGYTAQCESNDGIVVYDYSADGAFCAADE